MLDILVPVDADNMKMLDVALKLFRWDGIPPVTYGPNIRTPGGS